MARRRRPAPSSSPSQTIQPTDAGAKPGRAGVLLRVLASLAIAWHLVALVVPPLAIHVTGRIEPPGGGPAPPGVSVPPDPSSADAAGGPLRVPEQPRDASEGTPPPRLPIHRLSRFFAPYLNLLYLNHGYSFFAPEPGGSHLVEYEVVRADGSTVTGRFPELSTHWPRLRYHRHFMLADQAPHLVDIVMQTGAPPELVGRSYGRHLLRVHDGQVARLRLLYHRLLWPHEVLDSKSLRDEDTYELRGEEEVVAESTAEGQTAGAGGIGPRGETIRIP